MTADVRSRAQRDVVPAEPAHLGDAQAGLDRQQQQRPVAPTRPRALIRRGQKRLDLDVRQKRNRCAVVALTGDRQDALDQATMARGPQRRIVEKGVDRREADIAAASTGATLLLEIIEKRADHRRVEIVQGHRRRRFAKPLLGKAQEQAEGVAVARDGVRTGPLLA